MKKFIAYTLIFTLIFPAYCFSSPDEVLINDRSDETLLIEEIIDKVELIMEDGKVEEEEIFSLVEDIEPEQNAFCDGLAVALIISFIYMIIDYSSEILSLFIAILITGTVMYN